MTSDKHIDFGLEVSKILPFILKEATRKQMAVLSKEGMSVPHVVILDLLNEKSQCKMGDLAEALNLTMSAVTSIVDKMIDQKYLNRERSDEDRRIVLVELTKKGKDLADEITEGRKNASNDLFSALTEEERIEYLRLLRKVCEGLRER